MDYYIRFTDKLTILTDAQGILFLSMCKESQGILLRFSLELSKYQAEIVHVPGKDNETADVLSRHHPEIGKIQQEEMEQKPMTESQAMQILEKLKIPSGTRFTKEEVATLLEVPSLPNPVPKKARKSTAKEGVRIIKNTPKMVAKKKVKEPKTSNKRPGIIRPIKVNTIYVTKWYPGTNTSRAKRQTNKAIMRSRITEVRTVRTMSYNDFKTVSKAVLTGILTPREFKQAQAQDPFCQRILNSIQQKEKFCDDRRTVVFQSERRNKISSTKFFIRFSNNIKTFFSIWTTLLKNESGERHKCEILCTSQYTVRKVESYCETIA
jgi:hypothetical protein